MRNFWSFLEIQDFARSHHVSGEIHKISYSLTVASSDYFALFASIPETISATFYDNYEMIAPIYVVRQLSSLPHEFLEDTLFEYSSVRFSTAFIVPEDGNYTFYIMVSKNSKVDFDISGERIITIDNSLFTSVVTRPEGSTSTKILCTSQYGSSSWCLDTEQAASKNITYTTGDALYLNL